MEKYITDERTGLKYELVGDYYLLAGDNEPEEEQKPIGMWGQRHLSRTTTRMMIVSAHSLSPESIPVRALTAAAASKISSIGSLSWRKKRFRKPGFSASFNLFIPYFS